MIKGDCKHKELCVCKSLLFYFSSQEADGLASLPPSYHSTPTSFQLCQMIPNSNLRVPPPPYDSENIPQKRASNNSENATQIDQNRVKLTTHEQEELKSCVKSKIVRNLLCREVQKCQK